jgi:D-ribose pyranase
MKEIGILNRDIAAIISEQGHGDLLLIADAGYAIPKEIEVIDISLSENRPTVIELLEELKKFFSVEKIFMSEETRNISPSHFSKVSSTFGKNVEVEVIPQHEMKKKSTNVKAAIRTGDFTAYANVILVSGAGDRWYLENNNK